MDLCKDIGDNMCSSAAGMSVPMPSTPWKWWCSRWYFWKVTNSNNYLEPPWILEQSSGCKLKRNNSCNLLSNGLKSIWGLGFRIPLRLMVSHTTAPPLELICWFLSPQYLPIPWSVPSPNYVDVTLCWPPDVSDSNPLALCKNRQLISEMLNLFRNVRIKFQSLDFT